MCSAHHAGATLRYTTTKRLYVRTDITFATHINIAPERLYKSIYKLRRAFNNRFPQLSNVNFEYVYCGFIPLSRSTLPFFANVGKNVYSGAAGDGAGVTRAFMSGTFLADWVCGRDREELRYKQQCDAPSYVLQNHLEQLVLQLVLFGKICTHEARSKRKEAVYLYVYVIHC